MHDAVQAIEGKFRPYDYSDRRQRGVGSPEAAAAAAAHRVLVLLYSGQQASLDTVYDNYLKTNGLVGDPGLAVGEAAAVALYKSQYRKPLTLPDFFGGTEPGEWRSAVPMAFLELTETEPSP